MKRPKGTVLLGDDLKVFLASGPGMMVGTHDSKLIPELTRGWGARIADDRQSISVCISIASGRKTIANLKENGQIAFTFGNPANYKQLQVKGRCLAIETPDEDDLTAVEQNREEFASQCETVGTPRRFTENLFHHDVGDPPLLAKIRFAPEEMFDQTPGPAAGARL